jgi:hypothetical protein
MSIATMMAGTTTIGTRMDGRTRHGMAWDRERFPFVEMTGPNQSIDNPTEDDDDPASP